MPGMLYGYPFDEDLFLYRWQNERDPVLTAMLDSGVLTRSEVIRNLISNGSNQYTIPIYNKLVGDEINYDGDTDISADPATGKFETGVVYGRAKAWFKKDFTGDFNSGADPMGQIIARVSKYTADKRQQRLITILNGLFGIVGDADFALHTTNIATSTGTVADTNLMDATTANSAMQKALGDSKQRFALAIVHSKVATRLENLQLLQYRKYTDAAGITRSLAIADYNGKALIIDDGVPVTASLSASGAFEYTSYLFGTGAFVHELAPLKDNLPVEVSRDPAKFGGIETLYTRYRETMHPLGFSYDLNNAAVVNKVSPTDIDLGASPAWSRVADSKNISIARIITNG